MRSFLFVPGDSAARAAGADSVADAFAAAHPQFQPESVLGIGPRVTIWPHEVNANGMFIAAWKRVG